MSHYELRSAVLQGIQSKTCQGCEHSLRAVDSTIAYASLSNVSSNNMTILRWLTLFDEFNTDSARILSGSSRSNVLKELKEIRFQDCDKISRAGITGNPDYLHLALRFETAQSALTAIESMNDHQKSVIGYVFKFTSEEVPVSYLKSAYYRVESFGLLEPKEIFNAIAIAVKTSSNSVTLGAGIGKQTAGLHFKVLNYHIKLNHANIRTGEFFVWFAHDTELRSFEGADGITRRLEKVHKCKCGKELYGGGEWGIPKCGCFKEVMAS